MSERIGTLHLHGEDSKRLYCDLFMPTKERIQEVIEVNRKISEEITIIPTEDGFIVHDDNLDLSFLDEMRDATTEEQEGVNAYINSISHDTGINFFNYLEKK